MCAAKTKTKTKPKNKPAATGLGGAAGIRVRMYRVGFGDCFLLSLDSDAGPRHVLIDCGVHAKGDIKKIDATVADIAAETGGKLALVIATHAHQDHISGFHRCSEAFKKMQVGEVWLPWTEDPQDHAAVKNKAKRAALTIRLDAHFAAAGRADPAAVHAIANLAGNASALQLLHAGISGGKVKFLEAGQNFAHVDGIPGLAAQILGPPKSEKYLAKMDPPAGDRLFRAAKGGLEADNAVSPFHKMWNSSVKDYPKGVASAKDRMAMQEAAEDPAALAFALDQAMNNTSIVTLFTFRGKQLLFPGDAQYGNWQGWMDQQGSADILAGLDFYKVGHHGSHNATPKSAIDKMTKGKFAAMMSTQNKPWPSIPFGKLEAKLNEKASGWVRSDSISVPKAPKGPAAKLKTGFSQGPFWYDYRL